MTHVLTRRHFGHCAMAGAATLCAATSHAAVGSKEKTVKEKKTVMLPDGSRAPALGMGSWRLAAGRRPVEQELEALRTGLSLGMTLIDTAESYSNGASEHLVAQAIAGQRDKVFVVTKISPSNASGESSIRRSCERSLRNLGSEYIDLYLLHWRGGENLRAVVSTFEMLKKEGKIRHWGVSNFGVRDMEELLRIDGGKNCVTNQVRYSLSDRSMDVNGMVEWSVKNRMPLMAYSPLGSGSGLLKDAALAAIAQKHGVTAAAIAIAWTLRNGWFISIPESGSAAHIRENAKAASVVLDKDDLAQLDKAFPARQRSHWSGT